MATDSHINLLFCYFMVFPAHIKKHIQHNTNSDNRQRYVQKLIHLLIPPQFVLILSRTYVKETLEK